MRLPIVFKRRFFLIALCLLSFSLLCAQEYRIDTVTYNIKGLTREYALSKAVPIDTTRIFPDRSALETYLENILIQLKNQRVLEEASVSPSFGTETEDGLIPVSVLVSTKDTWNIIALPYPKYDSNSGFVFKLKIKDYNFFGTMRTLSGDISYEYAEDENHPHRIGAAVSFDIPFKLGLSDSNWTNNIDTSYFLFRFIKRFRSISVYLRVLSTTPNMKQIMMLFTSPKPPHFHFPLSSPKPKKTAILYGRRPLPLHGISIPLNRR